MPMAPCIMAGRAHAAIATGARRLTSSIWSICSWVRSVSTPLAGRAAFSTRTSTSARLGQPIHVLPGAEITSDRPPSDLLGERLEQLRPAAGEHQVGAPGRERAGDRLADPAGRAGDQHLAVDQDDIAAAV